MEKIDLCEVTYGSFIFGFTVYVIEKLKKVKKEN